jgi:CheY-like chemotaxis protein
VRHIVELHGGTATVESDGPGKGATFRVRLPVGSAQARRQSATAQRVATGWPETDTGPQFREILNGVRVLVVDDDPTTLDLLATLFRHGGADVLTADSADSALDQAQYGHPALIVSDIGMPGKDGYMFMRELRRLEQARGRHTPAIALTAYVRTEDHASAIAAGYEAHVAKPVAPQELMTIAASVLRSKVP